MTADGWIACSERMPGDGEEVIGFYRLQGRVTIGCRKRGYWIVAGRHMVAFDGDEWCSDEDVTHWQPLPPGPKEER